MTVSVEDFSAILGAGNPRRTSSVQWQLVEQSLGFDLPVEFKNFVSRYHGGAIDRELEIPDPDASLVGLIEDSSHLARKFRNREIVPAVVPIWPEPRGIFGWASCANGTRLYLLPPSGEDDEWVICAITFDNKWYRSESGFLEFLHDLLLLNITNPLGDAPWEPDEIPRFY